MNIAVFLAESPWGDIDELAIYKGLGGRETALVCLALEWGKLGHHVYAFVPRENFDMIEHEESGGTVRWIPNKYTIEVTEAVQPDLFISWENVQVLKELANFHGTTAIEMQVAHLDSDVPVGEVADYVCVLSEWAGDFFKSKHKIRDEQVVVFPNGVNMARFKDEDGPVVNRADAGDYHFIYSSSPDRGLHHLLRMWPRIQDAVMSTYNAESQLHVCYGIENFVEYNRWAHREDALRALDIEELISQQGVRYHGKVGQDVLAGLMLSCDLMLYPADTMSPTETGCISIVEALAASCPVVTTNCDCIPSEFGEVSAACIWLPFDERVYEQYVEAVVDALHPEDYQACVEAGKEFAADRDWAKIAQQWIDFFERR
jgi:glycosyltransferase involved in cell wall biosynthesis